MRPNFLPFFLFFCFLAFPQGTTVKSTKENTAADIVRQAIDRIHINSPKAALKTFQYKDYSKGTVRKQHVQTKEVIPSKHNFTFEQLSLHRYQEGNIPSETVLGSRFPGFQKPVYPFFQKKFHSASVYGKEYVLLDKRFFGPLSENGLEHYIYNLKETVSDGENPYHIVLFSPKGSRAAAQIEGELHIDSKSFSLRKAVITHSKNLQASVVHEYKYFQEAGMWFPSGTSAAVTPLNKLEFVSLFGNLIPVGRMRFEKEPNEEFRFTLTSSHFDIRLQESEPIEDKNIAITALKEENIHLSEFWEPYRVEPLTEEEKIIAVDADSVVREKNIEKRIQRLNEFGLGYYRLGFFDVDLKVLFKYNVEQGVRLGFGGVTNERLSEHFAVGGYLVRRLKENDFKYRLTTGFLLRKKSNTILALTYTDDQEEIGANPYLNSRRTYSLFEPRLVNITQFYNQEKYQVNLQHQLSLKLNTELEFSKTNVEQVIPYGFLHDGKIWSNYTVTEAKAGVLWIPFGQYMETPLGIIEYELGYPRVSAQVTQSFDGVLDGNFSFTKFDVKLDYQKEHINRTFTEIVLEGNMAFGDIPLTHAYHAYPNSPNKETILNRFSVAGTRSFETMYFGEFFSDRLASVQIKHRIKTFVLSGMVKPEFVLVTRHAIGNFRNPDDHLALRFNTLEKGYSESGFEINKIFLGFGLSFAYRYGAYHLPVFEDNIAFKFTFNLSL